MRHHIRRASGCCEAGGPSRHGSNTMVWAVGSQDAVSLDADGQPSQSSQSFGSSHLQNINTLIRNNAFDNFAMDHHADEPCAACELGKAHHKSFKGYSSLPKADQVRGRVHGDFCGPVIINEDPLGVLRLYNHPKYFLILVDEYSGKVHTELLNMKSQVANAIMAFIDLAESVVGQKCKAFHSDCGGEFNNSTLNQYMKSKSIIKTNSLPFTPQHNGTAERNIRTIAEQARTMLAHANLPSSFWPCALKTATYLNGFRLKHSITKTVNEIFFSQKPSINHLRTFGCDAYVLIPEHQRHKFDVKSVACIMVGYPENKTSGYVVFNPRTCKLIESRNITFFENKFTVARPIHNNDLGQSTQATSAAQLPLTTQAESRASSTAMPSPQMHASSEAESAISEDMNAQYTTSQSVPTVQSSQPAQRDLVQELMPATTSRPRRQRQVPQELGRHNIADFASEDRAQLRHAQLYLTCHVDENLEAEPIPDTWNEAMQSSQRQQWIKAIKTELDAHAKQKTWQVIPRPANAQTIDARWIFSKKYNADGTLKLHKARLVARGFGQVFQLNYFETFSPTLRYKSLKLILAAAHQWQYQLFTLDVKTAFLHAKLEEEVLVEPPQGVEAPPGTVLSLTKALYGLKQSPRTWNLLIDSFMQDELGFTAFKSDACVYKKTTLTKHSLIVAIFVDDILGAVHEADQDEWCAIKARLSQRFDIKDIGPLTEILGIQVERKGPVMTLNQSSMIHDLLHKTNMHNSHPTVMPEEAGTSHVKNTGTNAIEVPVYQSIIGSLSYLAYATRPDILHATNALSRYCSNPSAAHVTGLKSILRYLKGTAGLKLTFHRQAEDELAVRLWTDADWGKDRDGRKSVCGMVLKLGRCAVIWAVVRQKSVALSTAESEYYSLSEGIKELLWVRSSVFELTGTMPLCQVLCDNEASMYMTQHDSHSRARHIDLRYHFIRDELKKKSYELAHCPSEEMQADILTKATPTSTFLNLRNKIMNEGMQ